MNEYDPSGTYRCRAALSLMLATVVCAPTVLAQTNTGSIQGAVYDESMAVIPGVTVTATDVARGVERRVVTTRTGEFVMTLLPPGVYMLLFDSESFTPLTVQDFEVLVGEAASISPRMVVAAAGTILGNWQVSGIVALITGPPRSIRASGSSLNAASAFQTAD